MCRPLQARAHVIGHVQEIFSSQKLQSFHFLQNGITYDFQCTLLKNQHTIIIVRLLTILYGEIG